MKEYAPLSSDEMRRNIYEARQASQQTGLCLEPPHIHRGSLTKQKEKLNYKDESKTSAAMGDT